MRKCKRVGTPMLNQAVKENPRWRDIQETLVWKDSCRAQILQQELLRFGEREGMIKVAS